MQFISSFVFCKKIVFPLWGFEKFPDERCVAANFKTIIRPSLAENNICSALPSKVLESSLNFKLSSCLFNYPHVCLTILIHHPPTRAARFFSTRCHDTSDSCYGARFEVKYQFGGRDLGSESPKTGKMKNPPHATAFLISALLCCRYYVRSGSPDRRANSYFMRPV